MSNSVTPWTVAHQASLSSGISQARTLEWVVISSSRGSSRPRDQARVYCMAGRFFTTSATWEAQDRYAAAKSLQSCLTLCDPRDGSPPGSSIPGILQARVLEWVAISFSICSTSYNLLLRLVLGKQTVSVHFKQQLGGYTQCAHPIPKKGNAKECSNYHTSALISHASKVML